MHQQHVYTYGNGLEYIFTCAYAVGSGTTLLDKSPNILYVLLCCCCLCGSVCANVLILIQLRSEMRNNIQQYQ